jgi:hypothetical protein
VVAADSSDWLDEVHRVLGKPSLSLDAPKTVRAVVGDRDGVTIIWLYNLNIARLSSYEDRVIPAKGLDISVRVPFKEVASVTSSTADEAGAAGPLKFDTAVKKDGMRARIAVPQLDIATIITIQGE